MSLLIASRPPGSGSRFAFPRGVWNVVRRRVRRQAVIAVRVLLVALSTSMTGAPDCAAASSIDPALADRLAKIEDLAKARPERAQAALAALDADPSLPSDPSLRLRMDLLRAWVRIAPEIRMRHSSGWILCSRRLFRSEARAFGPGR